MNRGEIWLADLGYQGKVRPVLILSVGASDKDRALVTYVMRTTAIRGTAYEVLHRAPRMKPGAFDAQGLGSADHSRFIRIITQVDGDTLARVEDRVRAWLGL